MRPPDYDAIVIGAGPAGCGVARLLAAWKHRVLLVDRPGGQSRLFAESVPPSAQKVLAAIGVLDAIDAAGFLPWRGNTVWWGVPSVARRAKEGDTPPRTETFSSGASGYQIDRARFDALLRDLAADAGAEVQTGLVREARCAATDPDDDREPSVDLEVGGGTRTMTASFLLDCSGRAGVLARRTLRVSDTPARTIALAAAWRDGRGFGSVDPAHTLVASYDDGWAWSVPTESGCRYFTVMVDPARTDLARGESALEVYRLELAKVRAFAGPLGGADLAQGPWGADASPYVAREYAGRNFLLVGDAGSFIDPLSSFGVKKALASAWLAAIAIHTALTTADMRDEALAFFDRREREMASAAMRSAVEFAADAAAATHHPFWLARAERTADDGFDSAPDPAALARDPEVMRAFADLRTRPSVRLRRGSEARVTERAAVRGREIVMDDHLILPAWPHGVRYLRNVDLVGLTAMAPEHEDVGALYDAFVRAYHDVPLPDFLGALSVLIARGALVHEV